MSIKNCCHKQKNWQDWENDCHQPRKTFEQKTVFVFAHNIGVARERDDGDEQKGKQKSVDALRENKQLDLRNARN